MTNFMASNSMMGLVPVNSAPSSVDASMMKNTRTGVRQPLQRNGPGIRTSPAPNHGLTVEMNELIGNGGINVSPTGGMNAPLTPLLPIAPRMAMQPYSLAYEGQAGAMVNNRGPMLNVLQNGEREMKTSAGGHQRSSKQQQQHHLQHQQRYQQQPLPQQNTAGYIAMAQVPGMSLPNMQSSLLPIAPIGAKTVTQGGVYLLRMTEFDRRLNKTIVDNSWEAWAKFVHEFFTEEAVFRMWPPRKDKKEGPKASLDIPFAIFIRFFKSHADAGVRKMWFQLDITAETAYGDGNGSIEAKNSSWNHQYDGGQLVLFRGSIRFLFAQGMKLCRIDFMTLDFAELIPRSLLKKSMNENESEQKDLVKLPAPICSEHGLPNSSVRLLENFLVVKELRDLMEISLITGLSATESLKVYSSKIAEANELNVMVMKDYVISQCNLEMNPVLLTPTQSPQLPLDFSSQSDDSVTRLNRKESSESLSGTPKKRRASGLLKQRSRSESFDVGQGMSEMVSPNLMPNYGLETHSLTSPASYT